jgi:hypothetical protein
MLFMIVFVFIVFSIPRTIINIIELDHMLMWYYSNYVDSTYPAKAADCFDPPIWCQTYTTLSLKFIEIECIIRH